MTKTIMTARTTSVALLAGPPTTAQVLEPDAQAFADAAAQGTRHFMRPDDALTRPKRVDSQSWHGQIPMNDLSSPPPLCAFLDYLKVRVPEMIWRAF